MWSKPWNLTEAFTIGIGLVTTGLLLQYTVGPVDWDMLAWPVNAVLLALLVTGMAAVWWAGTRRGIYACHWLGGLDNAIGALGCVVVATLVMGLTRQVPFNAPTLHDNPLDALGLTRMLSFWPLVLLYLWLTFSLGVVVLRRLIPFHWRNVPFLLLHAGLLMVLLCGTLGSADMQRLKMYVAKSTPEWRALTDDGRVVELPLAIDLNQFVMEHHNDSLRTPKRYASDLDILTRDGRRLHTVIEVNRPASAMGWRIYQYGYDRMPGTTGHEGIVSILELVRDPWLPAVYTGIYMLIAGALCLLFITPRKKNDTDDLATV